VQTVDKALGLLEFFSEQRPSIGLSDMARLAGFNKATTLRFLAALEKHGFVEQAATTRAYTLGPGLLRLARVREATNPVTAIVQPILEELVAATGETAHFSLYAGGSLATIGLAESAKSNRVMIGKGEAIPVHATASGIAFLAFAGSAVADSALGKSLRAYTERTITDPQKIRRQLASVRRLGVAVVKNTYEDGVCGIGAPVIGSDGLACGAIAIAVPLARAQRKMITLALPAIRRAANEITVAMGAEPHPGMTRQDMTASA
jgi:DNA-binding IclR family transcriptional regulator